MLEIIVERWSSFDSTVEYRWSLWRDGKRLQMGGPHPTVAASEADARHRPGPRDSALTFRSRSRW
jgi:hypothetical protein